MVIVYNPATGSTISEKFRSDKLGLEKSHAPKEMKYYDPQLAEALLSTYPFLQILTPQEAQTIKEQLEKPVGEFKCECGLSFSQKIALVGHQRSHKKEEEIKLDLPVAETIKVEAKTEVKSEEIPDDLKGVGWYGEGVKEDHG